MMLPHRRPDTQDGSAILEFVFVAVLVLVPLIYLIVAVAVVQRSRLATSNAARDVGRAVATATGPDDADIRAAAALRIAFSAQNLTPDDVELRYVAADSDCQAGQQITPQLTAAAVFAVCVIRHQPLPAVPTIVAGRGVTTIGRFVVHIDDYRSGG